MECESVIDDIMCMVRVIVRMKLMLETRLAVEELILVMFDWKLVPLLIARVQRLIIDDFRLEPHCAVGGGGFLLAIMSVVTKWLVSGVKLHGGRTKLSRSMVDWL